MSYNEILARSNRDIMKMANKGFFLPGKGPENYKDDVDKNNDLLLENIKKENDEKKQQFNEEKGFFSQLYDDIVTGHVFTDFSNAGKSVTKRNFLHCRHTSIYHVCIGIDSSHHAA